MTRLGFRGALVPVGSNDRRTTMTIASHLVELRKKHETLSEQVEQAQRSPGTDALKIAELKKQKLRLKEEITRLSH
jgi:hypothetical protein